MTDLVVDASVVVKWVIDEEGTEQALALRTHRLFAPDLLVAECANVFWKKARRREMTADQAVLAAELLQRADIELVPTRGVWGQAARWAITLDHPAYDCVYLAVAASLACDLVTADTALQRLSRKLAGGPKVRLLEQAA
jgi:predicted nucleic acid-binding protein